MTFYQIIKNGKKVANSLTHAEASKMLTKIVNDDVIDNSYYIHEEDGSVIHPDSKRILFQPGDERAQIGDNFYKIEEE